MTNIIDGGPIYGSLNVTLNGNISEIFSRIAKKIDKLIVKICKNDPRPKKQKGNVVNFIRLKNKNNKLLNKYTIEELYDRIRMVDSKDYQKAYINFGNYKIEFSNCSIENKKLHANIILYQSDN